MTNSFQQRSAWSGLKRGAVGLCPQCGEGRLFSSYLKIVPTCAVCAHSLAQYRADDGPAYFTILIIGHVVLAPFLMSSIVLTWPLEWLFALFLPSVVVLTLALLPRVKGAFVGIQWAVGDRSGIQS